MDGLSGRGLKSIIYAATHRDLKSQKLPIIRYVTSPHDSWVLMLQCKGARVPPAECGQRARALRYGNTRPLGRGMLA